MSTPKTTERIGPRRFAPVNGSTSRWVTDTLPESDMTVLIRCSGDEYPVWPGFHDGEQWCSADGSTLEGPVLGWMELETAAEVLDGKVTVNSELKNAGPRTPDVRES